MNGIAVNMPVLYDIKVGQTTDGVNINLTPPPVFRVERFGNTIEDSKVLGPPPRGLQALGWRFFQDSRYTMTNPLYLPQGQRSQIPDDGKGLLMNAYGVNSSKWLNAGNGRLYPDAAGDFWIYRLNMLASPVINNKAITIDFDIGTPNRIFSQDVVLDRGAGQYKPVNVPPLAHGSSLAHKNNGGAFYVTPDCDIMIANISIMVDKTFSVDPLS